MKRDPLIDLVVSVGLMTEAEGDALDAWAEDLAKRFTAGEITEAEKDRLISERLERDLARRGQP